MTQEREYNYKAEAKYLQVIKKLDAQEWSDAFILANKLQEEFPDFGATYYALGFLFTNKIGDLERGLQMYRKCAELDVHSNRFYTGFIALLSSLRKYNELEKYLEIASDLPGMDLYVVNIEYALMYETQKKYDKAIEYFKKAFEYDFKDNASQLYNAHVARCEEKKKIFG